MMRALVVVALAIGCSSPTQAPPQTPQTPQTPPGSPACRSPDSREPLTPEECTCLGGRVNLSRGGEQEHCASGETELGAIRFGIEGGWCCKAL